MSETTESLVAPAPEVQEINWETIGKKQDNYSAAERDKMASAYEKTLTSINEHQVLEGKVVEKTIKDVVVNINYKSEGVIPLSEFRYNPDLKVGDSVEVYVEKQEDKNGQLVLSHKKARFMRAWERVNSALATNEIIKGFVKCRTKGGLIVDVFGMEAFLPGSQIDVKPVRDYDAYVNKTMEFKVVKINPEFKNVVVSHKALIEAEIEQQKQEIIGKLEKGQVLEGTVKNITSYGVFIDLGGVDGLIHITDLSWFRITHPEEVVKMGDKIHVVILDFDNEKKRIQLGLKQLSAHPWDSLSPDLKVGDRVKGKIVVVADYGAFIEIAPGVEGLIHVSEMSWSQHLRTAHDFFKVGGETEAIVLTLNREERKMTLGINEIVFCARDLSTQLIMDAMSSIPRTDLEFKIAPPESWAIIGSNSIHTSGELYVIDVHAISTTPNIRDKRILDFTLCSLFLILSPLSMWLQRKPFGFIRNIFRVGVGTASWVGYTPEGATQRLPKIKKGILSPADAIKPPPIDEAAIHNLNSAYARNYHIMNDLKIVWKGFSRLGR